MAKSFMITLLKIFTFILTLESNSAFITSPPQTLITTTTEDQIACTICVSCENPCQPLPSSPPPPPPPEVICPPPPPAPPLPECPPPPAPKLPECPPPPAPPLPECPTPPAPPLPECPPPPAPTSCPECSPPSPDVPQLSPPPTMPMPHPPPPTGPLVPEDSNSSKMTLKLIFSSLLLLLSLLCCF